MPPDDAPAPRPARLVEMTGGEAVVASLLARGVDRVFCVPGESFLPILDALYAVRDSIEVVSCRHEHGAAMMAEAHAKLTGRPGVCLVTRGPGACNGAIGVHTAFQDSTPLLYLIGQVGRPFLGREAFQEVDLARMFQPLAKHAEQVLAAERLPAAIAGAWRLALERRPGPVVLALPEDVLAERRALPPIGPAEPIIVEPPDPGLMERLHRVLGDAERPVMLLGGGGWTEAARADIQAFAEANDLATCCSFRRHDLFDNRHRNFIGELGIAPDPALVARVRAADVLLIVGARCGEITSQGYQLLTLVDATKAPPAGGPEIIHVYPEPGEFGRVFRPSLAIAAGVSAFATAAAALAPLGGQRWRAWTAAARADHLADRTRYATRGALDPAAAMTWLDGALPEDAIVTVDAGNFSGWPQRFLSFGGGRRLLGTTNGAMGYAVPAAIAAKLARRERVVTAFVGDGGFGMTGQELATAMAHDAAIVVLIFNNSMYGTIRMHQERRYPGRVAGTDLRNPDYVALAAAHGAHGERVTATEDFAPAFMRAVASGRPALIELVLDPALITSRRLLSEIAGASGTKEDQA